ncbi:hypothetical protein KI387_006301, partial [Taxus chinensis]
LRSVRGAKRHLDTCPDSQTRFVRTRGAASQSRDIRDRTRFGALSQRLRPTRRTQRA